MRKIILNSTISVIVLFVGLIIFFSTIGIKTNKFNNLFDQKVNQINSKIKLNLKDVNFKLNISKFVFEVITLNPTISINKKKIDLERINFDLNILRYLKNENSTSRISIVSKENNIDQLVNFINEYEFNLARHLILKQIKKGKVKITTDIIFDQKQSNKLKYFVRGYVNNAEVKFFNNLKAENIKFDFKIERNIINLKDIKFLFDGIFITSNELNINKVKNQFEINGNLKTKKTKLNLKRYSKIISSKFDILDDKPINISSDNKLSFKINNKFTISNLKLESVLNFDELLTESQYQDFIYLKNGNVKIDYNKKELNINLDSKFLFKKDKYNISGSENLFKLVYKKTENSNAVVNLDLSNTNNKINSEELKKFISFKNFSLPTQDINFSSKNNIKFNINKNNKIINLDIRSKINTDEVLVDYKSKRIKKYLSNFKNQIKLSKSEFDINFNNSNFNVDLKSKYSINNIRETINLNIEKKDNNYSFRLDMDLDSAELLIDELEYIKNKDIKSNLYLKGIYKDNKEIIFNNIKFKEEEKYLLIQNLEIGKKR